MLPEQRDERLLSVLTQLREQAERQTSATEQKSRAPGRGKVWGHAGSRKTNAGKKDDEQTGAAPHRFCHAA